MLADLQLLRPLWLLALVPLVLALVWLWHQRPGLQRWKNIVDEKLAPHVLIGGAGHARRYPLALVALAGTLAIVALAGPVWQKMPTPVFTSEDGLVIALDLSRSMNTEDVTPSRIDRARFKIADILNRREEGQTAMIVYAAEAFTVSPLTDDAQTIVAQLPALEPGLMPAQGSRADRAIVKAQALLEQAGQTRGDVLLITDGADDVRATQAARELAKSGYRLSVLGVGTPEGGPIPGDGNFVRRADGSIVISALDRGALAELSRTGGGIYQELTPDQGDVERLAILFEARQPSAVDDSGLEADVWREEGPWLLLPLLLLAALAFRRGVLVAVAAILLLPPLPAHAFEVADWFARPDQRARRALEAGHAAQAAELFRDPAWKAVAEYRAGDFEQALQSLESLEGPEAQYNRGNALARLGQYEAAIEAYERVLEQDPDHEDARFNRDLLREQQQSGQSESGETADQQQNGAGEQGQQGAGDQGEQSGQSQQAQQGGQEQQGDQSQQTQQGGQEQQGDQSQQAQQGGQEQQRDQSQQTQQGGLEQGDGQSQQAGQSGQEAGGPPDESTQTDDGAGRESQQPQQHAEALGQPAGSEPNGENARATNLAATDEPLDESAQAIEQWLRRIPDDPGGLLRRKFLYQYNRRQPPEQEQQQW